MVWCRWIGHQWISISLPYLNILIIVMWYNLDKDNPQPNSEGLPWYLGGLNHTQVWRDFHLISLTLETGGPIYHIYLHKSKCKTFTFYSKLVNIYRINKSVQIMICFESVGLGRWQLIIFEGQSYMVIQYCHGWWIWWNSFNVYKLFIVFILTGCDALIKITESN